MLIVCQLLTVCCTRPAFPGQSFPNIKSQSEKKDLKIFLDSGTEKKTGDKSYKT